MHKLAYELGYATGLEKFARLPVGISLQSMGKTDKLLRAVNKLLETTDRGLKSWETARILALLKRIGYGLGY